MRLLLNLQDGFCFSDLQACKSEKQACKSEKQACKSEIQARISEKQARFFRKRIFRKTIPTIQGNRACKLQKTSSYFENTSSYFGNTSSQIRKNEIRPANLSDK